MSSVTSSPRLKTVETRHLPALQNVQLSNADVTKESIGVAGLIALSFRNQVIRLLLAKEAIDV